MNFMLAVEEEVIPAIGTVTVQAAEAVEVKGVLTQNK
jgi:hypothetical protein